MVAIALTGNEIGLERDEFSGLDDRERSRLTRKALDNASRMGAHCVVFCVSDLPGTLEDIE